MNASALVNPNVTSLSLAWEPHPHKEMVFVGTRETVVRHPGQEDICNVNYHQAYFNPKLCYVIIWYRHF